MERDPDDIEIGKKLSYLRKRYNLTQKQICKLLDIVLFSYKHYESGERTCPIYLLTQFAIFYKINIDFFFDEKYAKKMKQDFDAIKDIHKICDDSMKNLTDDQVTIFYSKDRVSFNIRLNMKNFRIKAKKTQLDVADYLKITESAYNKYENGKRKPSNEVLVKLAELYNCSVDIFVR